MSMTFAMSKRYILLSKMWRNTYSWPRSLPDFCCLTETMRDCAEHETDSDKKKYKLPNRQIFVEQISQCEMTKNSILSTRQQTNVLNVGDENYLEWGIDNYKPAQ